jgi:hypothetical protein
VTDGEFTSAPRWGGRPVARRIADARPRHRVVATGAVRELRIVDVGPAASCSAVVGDGTGDITLVFLGRPEVPGLEKGSCCTFEGTARMGDGRLVIWNPRYRLEPHHADHA